MAEGFPSPAIEHRRRRPAQPHRVPVEHTEHHEDDAEQVADERGVEPDQAVAAEEGDRQRDEDTDESPDHGPPIERSGTRRPSHPFDGTARGAPKRTTPSRGGPCSPASRRASAAAILAARCLATSATGPWKWSSTVAVNSSSHRA